MTKHIDIAIDKHQTHAFLKAVRTKKDVIVIWMNTIKVFLTNTQATGPHIQAKLSLVVMSMSRLFCELSGGEKIFSLAFPFVIRTEDEALTFYSRGGIQIDNRISSQILALIEGSQILEVSDFSHFIDPIIDASDVDAEIWCILRELMLAEDGYLRYDWDRARINGHLHPEYHMDFCYTSGNSFKLGLQGNIDTNKLISILNIEVDCLYLLSADRLTR